jgi:Ca2+-binding EF-hand superfamily protein
MKKILFCILSLALVTSFPSSAMAAKGKARKGGKANPAAVVKRFDENSNGAIDEAELAKLQKAFEKGKPALQQLDKDKDGTLSSGEVFAVQKAKKKKGKKK